MTGKIMEATELQQGSSDWFEARIGYITASNVGAILGLSPFRNRTGVMRSMVREYQGALSEFTGNIATEYGVFNEVNARLDYEMKTGNIVEATGFHTYENWLGASPDGFVKENGLIEIKCPFSLRNGGEFKSIEAQPHYYAQIQIQMLVAGKQWCHFVQWQKDDFLIEFVERDEKWIEKNLPKLREFYEEYLSEREYPNCEKHLKPRHEIIEPTAHLETVIDDYFLIKARIKALEEQAKTMLSDIVVECGENESQIGQYRLTLVNKKTMSYAKAVKALIPDTDLSEFETHSTYWVLK